MTVALTYGTLNINDQTNYKLGEGLDLGEPAFENMLSSNIRSEGSRYVATRTGDREIKVPLAVVGTSATGFAANARALWAEMLKGENTLNVILPGMDSGVTFDTKKATADVNLSTLLLSAGLKDYEIELTIPAKPWGDTATTALLGATGAVETPCDWPITGVTGDTGARSSIYLGPATGTWEIVAGRRANYNASFTGINDDSGDVGLPATGDVTCYGGNYGRATGVGATPVALTRQVLTVATGQGTYRLFARCRASDPTGAAVRSSTYVSGLGLAVYGDSVPFTKTSSVFEVLDLGTITLPPTLPDEAGPGTVVNVQVNVSQTASGNVDCDFTALIPIDGGFLKKTAGGPGNVVYVSDGISSTPGGYTATPDFASYFPLKLVPHNLFDLSPTGNNLVVLAYVKGDATTNDAVKLTLPMRHKYRPQYYLL